MTTLVDDLLLLARLDSGRPLAQERVELSGLVVEAVSDAHAAGPEHRWRLDLPEEAGDRPRRRRPAAPGAGQPAGQRAHPHPGRHHGDRSKLATDSGRQAVITVVDDGPGIPRRPAAGVFERFARGDTSRSRAAGSTGLGLAIVAAVVEAHRGGSR